MGGIGFIERNKLECMLSVLINTNLLLSILDFPSFRPPRYRPKYFFSSSACVYRADMQDSTIPFLCSLQEKDAYPAMPEDGYGWEKLFSERMCRHFHEAGIVDARVARFHNVYGPHGTWQGGREKAPAAICRKVVEAIHSGNDEIEIWGDGEQTRSFMYIDDCVEGVVRLMASSVSDPINIGSSEMVSINQLVRVVEEIAGVKLKRHYVHGLSLGVRGRNSDNTKIKRELWWEPSTKLIDGMRETYLWVKSQYDNRNKISNN